MDAGTGREGRTRATGPPREAETPSREAGRSAEGAGREAGAPGLELRGLTKRFGDLTAVDGVDLRLREGEFLTLLGPSGCGKTTVLRLVAGFETPDAGRILFGGRDVGGRSPQARGFGMVFQNYALFPHLDVFENVAFGLRSRGEDRETIERRVAASLERVDLPGFGERRVQQLSGGQQQRVALARALAIEPPLLLLDEPLSNLDAALRERTRTELRLLVKELGITALFVTHDQEEAFDLSDRVAVMRAGRIRQVGTPEALYDHPADRFVATFVGKANVLPGTLEGAGPSREEGGRGPERRIRLDAGPRWPVAGVVGEGLAAGDRAEAIFRPESVELAPSGDREAGAEGTERPAQAMVEPLTGEVRDRRFRGATVTYRADLADGPLLEVTGGRGEAAPGDRVELRPRPGARIHAFAPEADG